MIITLYLLIHLILLIYLVYIIARLIPVVLFVRQPLPYVPINQRAAKMMANLPELAQVKTIIDLGCGTGTLLAPISRACPRARLVGIDFNTMVLRLARWRSLVWRHKPSWELADMFTYPIQEFDAIVGWWVPDFATRLLPKFLNECKPQAVIICYMFPLPEHPELIHTTQACGREWIHIYRRRN